MLSLVLAIAACAPARVPSPAPASLALVGATVVDARSGALLPDRTVLVAGNRILAVGPRGSVRVPAGARVVDAAGKYLIPGLWDMHAHLTLNPAADRIDVPLLVAHGVTGVREMVSDCPEWSWVRQRSGADCLERLRGWQRAVEAGEMVGPRILALGGWPVNGPNGLSAAAPAYFRAETAEQGRELARYNAARGVDFVKVYSGISREGFLAFVGEARRLGLGVAGHEPIALSAIDASEAGQKSFEHARVFLFNCFPGAEEFRRATADLGGVNTHWRRRMVDEYDPALCTGVFRAFARNGSAYVPTHLTRKFDAFADDSAYRHDPRSKYIPGDQWEAWNGDAEGMIESDSSRAGRRAMMDFYTKGLEITAAAYRAGVTVMVGTDSGDSYVFPGSAVHDEMGELVKAGLTPAEALRAATWTGAEFLGRTADSGSVAPGRLADLVLLDANPLADIANTRRIAGVALNGRWLDRPALDALLAGAERTAASMR